MKGALQVWSGHVSAGLLARTGASIAGAAHTFAYHTTELGPEAQVSLTMPIRLESWNSNDLHPIFQMNLPEGALLDAIKRAVSKVTDADSLSILRITGGNQVGRNRFSLPGDRFPGIHETSESLEELLTYPDTKPGGQVFILEFWPYFFPKCGSRSSSEVADDRQLPFDHTHEPLRLRLLPDHAPCGLV